MSLIKLPIRLENCQMKELMGLDKCPTIDAIAYIKVEEIESVRQAHDDTISEELNLEASAIMMKSGDSYLILMGVDELMEKLAEHAFEVFITK